MDSSSPSLVREVLGVKLFSDDTVVRGESPWPDIPADPTFENGPGSKDAVINNETHLSVRIFLPKSAMEEAQEKKLPLVIYFHGGGFVTFSAASSYIHNVCNNTASKFGLLVVSVDYRLAPEHRLPVAFEDAFETLKWIQNQANGDILEPWLRYADFSRCLLMGESAGATIVHNMAVKTNEYDFSPLQIKGLILTSPFFGGVERTESEIRSLPDALTLEISDNFWFFALPKGSGRDHAYCRCPRVQDLDAVHMPPCLVVQGAKDILYSRNMEYVEHLRQANMDVELLEYKDKGHLLPFPHVDDEIERSYREMIHFMAKCFGSE